MGEDQIDNLMIPVHKEGEAEMSDKNFDHMLEQYRIYLHIFNATSDHRHKSNEFFLGLNTAIMGIMGYIETKDVPHAPIIFFLVPLVGMAICFCWYEIIISFRQLNRAKFQVIHAMEKKLSAILFDTEWKILGEGKQPKKYRPLSRIEKLIPIIFIVLYLIIFISYSPIADLF